MGGHRRRQALSSCFATLNAKGGVFSIQAAIAHAQITT
jgi:hypothetical protein